ncbi:hypothetical protein [Rummeliibacillus stabekisii]|uniref:hypothetical protein n=1 Tax=Rummeliibacillus stabekisii TaxID=241244 RepID=UPI00116C4F7B|nr:hypothetical protein [Rummeliibacillus stabekisii]MBB5171618.1 hypothetical protein [Rummeliibacillus stabekisii]GEL05465.1 hypothetical protein RST01_20920 [Rummeliibacillus stabekisii]
MNTYILAAILTVIGAAASKILNVSDDRLKRIKPIEELRTYFTGATIFGCFLLSVKYVLTILMLGGFGAGCTYLAINIIKISHFAFISPKVLNFTVPFLITQGYWKNNLHCLINFVKAFGKERIKDEENSVAHKEKESILYPTNSTQND